jgi:hypothetical protein
MRGFRAERYLIPLMCSSMDLFADLVFPIVILIVLEMIHAIGPMVLFFLVDPLSGS